MCYKKEAWLTEYFYGCNRMKLRLLTARALKNRGDRIFQLGGRNQRLRIADLLL